MNVLISSAGRRVALAECFRESFSELGIKGRIVAVDSTRYSPAGQLADAYHVVPKCTEHQFLAEVLDVCEREDVNLIVPTIDIELPIYARSRDEFRKRGIHVSISAPEAVSICCDKIETHSWLESHGFPVPKQSTPELVLRNREAWPLPLIMKPRDGSASIGLRLVSSFDELEHVCCNTEGPIVQELAPGVEHTVNVFVDRECRCLCAVPHVRMEVRGGEVSKGMTVKESQLISLVCRIAETLPGAYGALNVQCFLTCGGNIRIIEINGRFGGGYPLAHRAGAHMTTWLLEEAMGLKPCGPFDQWENELLMLRYDEALFVNKDDIASYPYVNSVYRVRS
jgi:carbamoyl-phosphate synthase large subunit